jgi:hypothetical protein
MVKQPVEHRCGQHRIAGDHLGVKRAVLVGDVGVRCHEPESAVAAAGQARRGVRPAGPIYGWFTEGFDTADLQEAKALLAELGRISPLNLDKNFLLSSNKSNGKEAYQQRPV